VRQLTQLSGYEEKLGGTTRWRRCAGARRRWPVGLDTVVAAWSVYNLGKTHAREQQWDAAILYGKRALNLYQVIIARMAGLERELQQGFVNERADTYRAVADWMVNAGRLAEAQQVLDMLKGVELSGLLRAPDDKVETLPMLGREREADKAFAAASQDVVRLSGELGQLLRKGSDALSPEDESRRAQLETRLGEARLAFDRYVAQLHQRFEMAPAERMREVGSMQLDRLVSMRRTLAELGEGVVLVHYVVAPERLAIILTTPRVQVARESAIREDALNRAVFELRTALQDPKGDAVPAARRMHEIAMRPIERDLAEAGAKTVMLSLDGTLRYVPFAALHDGSGYLASRYSTALFTAASRDKLKDRPKSSWTMAGLGVTREHKGFAALPSVKMELESIRGRVMPGEIHLDEAFTTRRLQDSLDTGFALVHVASHFKFSPGAEADSFLLMGDGSRLSLRDIRSRNLDFGAADLVTLSACETAMGGGRDDTGREVEGLGALLQNQGAKGVVATLWPVADDSTARFMWTFYSARGASGGTSKAEALRRAQVDFIARTGADRRLAHPFYWAPYILMGNWL
jgi:CHAT domain-containing protein